MDQKSVDIKQKVTEAKAFFESGKTLSYEFRYDMLNKLKLSVLAHQQDILEALSKDLNKSFYEGYMAEVGLVIAEINEALKKLKKWMKPKRPWPGLTQMPAGVKIYPEPYGVVLIMSPWNYPFQLTMIPLIGALAAGNCVLLKPSNYSPHTSFVLHQIMAQVNEGAAVQVIEGGREENQALLDETFDYIFFTGSPKVGHLVMAAAAKNLTPITLELGGKSPCIVDKDTDLVKTVKRILFGKLLNAGQTCVAPDYLMLHEDVYEPFLLEIKKQWQEAMPSEAYLERTLPKIINQNHFNRLKGLIQGQTLLMGGNIYEKTMQIGLTLVEAPDLAHPLMTDEIFGPIFPVMKWKEKEEVISFIRKRPKPLALYLFTKNKELEKEIVGRISYGGGCINDTIMHITASNQPFGGVGNSGMGAYHGVRTFETFSHQKNVVKKWWAFDLPLRHHPYKDKDKTPPSFLFR